MSAVHLTHFEKRESTPVAFGEISVNIHFLLHRPHSKSSSFVFPGRPGKHLHCHQNGQFGALKICAFISDSIHRTPARVVLFGGGGNQSNPKRPPRSEPLCVLRPNLRSRVFQKKSTLDNSTTQLSVGKCFPFFLFFCTATNIHNSMSDV